MGQKNRNRSPLSLFCCRIENECHRLSAALQRRPAPDAPRAGANSHKRTHRANGLETRMSFRTSFSLSRNALRNPLYDTRNSKDKAIGAQAQQRLLRCGKLSEGEKR